jgi:hypothetical protein
VGCNLTPLPVAVVRSVVEAEMTPALAWAERSGYELEYDDELLVAHMRLDGAPNNGQPAEHYLLEGSFDGYRALPPAWRFLHPTTEQDIGPAAYPALPQPNPFESGVFISGGPTGALICAHFNRLAYTELGGVHGDWGAPSNWQNPPTTHTVALKIGQMLQRIALETRLSSGRMAPLS